LGSKHGEELRKYTLT